MIAYPDYPGRRILFLDGVWDFHFTENCPDPARPDFDAVVYDDQMAVPGVFDMLPRYAGKRGTGFYRTRVRVPARRRLLLKLRGVSLYAAVFWDGRPVGIDDLPYSGVEFQFDSGESDEHELVIVIDNRLDFNRTPLFSGYYDYYGYGGIIRSVELHQLPDFAFDRATVRTLSLSGRVRVNVTFSGNVPEEVAFRCRFDDGPESELHFTVAGENVEFEADVPSPTLWSPEKPNLHTLTLWTENDAITECFGLRTIEASRGELLLNGKPLTLRGVCRHESHPEFGPALPLQILFEDVGFLKELGCNFVRGSHYPQDQRFLDLCDRNGILVWEEGIGWGDGREHVENPVFRSAQLRQLAPMVKNSGNHPAVILWGFLNEGDSSAPECRSLYAEMAKELRRLDDSRPITYASMRHEQDINFDLVDVVSLNTYPGWYAQDCETPRPLGEIAPSIDRFLSFLHEAGFDDKPFLISEIGAGAIYGWRDRLKAHWSEEYQADYLTEVCRCIAARKRISGVALWQFLDCRTYATSRALGRPRAFNNKGLLDEYRRPKLAFDAVRRGFREVADRGEK